MYRLVSIVLSSMILLQSIGVTVHDLAQLGNFIEHAQYHKQHHGDTIFVFISKHYGDLKANHEREHHNEKRDHEQLPFHHQSHMCAISVFILNIQDHNIARFEFLEFQNDNFIYKEPSSSLYTEDMFQPPRLS